ncbi:hypothetical protein GGH91_002067, partial [Coemansia sp. RSA 2671]
MSQASGSSSTPRGAGRTQTSIFKFFTTPKKTSTVGSKTTDSQEALLDEISAAIDDDVLADVEVTESTFASPVRPALSPPKVPASRNRKRKASPTLDEPQSDASGSDTPDDDEDADYNPNAAAANGVNSKGRGRVIDDSDDDIDDIGDIGDIDDLDEVDLSPPP